MSPMIDTDAYNRLREDNARLTEEVDTLREECRRLEGVIEAEVNDLDKLVPHPIEDRCLLCATRQRLRAALTLATPETRDA